MKRHVFAFISSLVVLVGIFCMLLGLAFGGRFGSYQFSNGQLYYQTADEKIVLWSSDTPFTSPNTPSTPDVSPTPSTPFVSDNNIAATVPAADLQKLSIEIDAGYINIETGDVPSLTVDGEMPYSASFNSGKWTIYSDIDSALITTRGAEGKTHYYLNGKDITTTFTIVIPTTLEKVDVSSSLGTTTLTSITTKKLSVNTEMGTTTLTNCTTTDSELSSSMGTIKTENLITEKCNVSSEMGSIVLNGTISNSLTAESEMGSVIAKLTRPDNYSWDIDSSMGSVILDGKKTTGSGSFGNGNGVKFDLSSSMGTVKIIFV